MSDNLDIGDVITKLAENPGLVKDIMNTMGISQGPGENEEEKSESSFGKNETVLPRELPFFKFGGSGKHREELLRALRPYLGEDRRQKVDYIIKVMKLIEMGGLVSAVQFGEKE